MSSTRSDVHEALNEAIRTLSSDDWQARESAVEVLTQFGVQVAPYLFDVLRDPRDEVRQDAAAVLHIVGWQPQTNEEYMLYVYAAQQWDLLVEMGEQAVPVLAVALQDANFYVRTSAVLGLGEIGHETVFPLLAQAVQDSNSYVRSAAARSLGRFGVQARSALGQALLDGDKGVRSEAAKALVALGEAAVPTLIEALQSCDWYLRREIAQALVKVGQAAIPALTPLFQSEEFTHEAAQIFEAWGIDPAQYGYRG